MTISKAWGLSLAQTNIEVLKVKCHAEVQQILQSDNEEMYLRNKVTPCDFNAVE